MRAHLIPSLKFQRYAMKELGSECVKCSELIKLPNLLYAVEYAINDENCSVELDIYKYAFQSLTETDRESLFLKPGETGTLIDTVEIYHPE